MRIVFALILVMGMGLAGFAVYMAQDRFSQYQSVLESQRAALAKNVPVTTVFVAAGPLRYGQRLREEDIRAVAWPQNALPEGIFTDKDELVSDDPKRLRTVLRAIEKDEPILAVKVTEPGEDAGVSSRLEKGQRAFAIRVDVASGVSGFLRPGDTVDVYWTGEARGREVTKLIESKLKLIAVDQIADGDANRPVVARTVTVAATPRQVGNLAQAQNTGKLALSLRGAEDDTVAEGIEIDQSDLLGLERRQEARVEKEKVCTIKTRRGSEVVDIPIPCSN